MKNVKLQFLYAPDDGGGVQSFGLDAIMAQHLDAIPPEPGEEDLKDPDAGEDGDPPAADPPPEEGDKGGEDPPAPKSNLEELSAEELIAEIGVREGKTVELDKQLQEHVAKITELEEGRSVTKQEEFVTAFKADPKKALRDYAKELELPNVETLGAVMARGSVEERLSVWQEKILPKQIEKEFDLQEGEFEVNPADIYKAKTPSYKWAQLSRVKEAELQAEDAAAAKQGVIPAEQLEAYHTRQSDDLNAIAKDFFGGGQEGDSVEIQAANTLATDKVNALLLEMQSIPEKIVKGEATQDKHPFEMRNLLRGVHFDALSDIKVQAAVNDLLEQLRSKGVQIPADLPTDLSSVKPKGELPKKETTPVFSPMQNAMNGFL